MIDFKSFIAIGITVLGAGVVTAQETPETEPAPAAEPATATPAPPMVTSGLSLTLDSNTDIERRTVIYQCDNGEGFRAQYINAAPNFLAILPVEGETYLFVTALSGSGARYVSGPYEWWSDGADATLRDLRGDEDEPPIATCLAASGTP